MGKALLSIFGKGTPAPGVVSGRTLFVPGASAASIPAPITVATQSATQSARSAPRPRLVFAVDATESREATWRAAKQLTDVLLAALPGELDVALAVHGGNRLHTFTKFTSDAGALRNRAASVRCEMGYTRLLDILARVLETEGVSVVCYVGDAYEESARRGYKLAESLKARGIRLIVLFDGAGWSDLDSHAAKVLAEMARRTGGALLPFDITALPKLRDLLEAVAVLAVGDVPLLTARQDAMPAARLLLQHLGKDAAK